MTVMGYRLVGGCVGAAYYAAHGRQVQNAGSHNMRPLQLHICRTESRNQAFFNNPLEGRGRHTREKNHSPLEGRASRGESSTRMPNRQVKADAVGGESRFVATPSYTPHRFGFGGITPLPHRRPYRGGKPDPQGAVEKASLRLGLTFAFVRHSGESRNPFSPLSLVFRPAVLSPERGRYGHRHIYPPHPFRIRARHSLPRVGMKRENENKNHKMDSGFRRNDGGFPASRDFFNSPSRGE